MCFFHLPPYCCRRGFDALMRTGRKVQPRSGVCLAVGVVVLGLGRAALGEGAFLGGAAAEPAGTQPLRLAVPADEAQDKARLTLVSVFQRDLAKKDAASRQALAKRLLAQAIETKDNPTMRYVALDQAMELASLAGDPGTAFRAAGELARLYVLDPIETEKRALFRSNAAPDLSTRASESVATLALTVADAAALKDDFDSVQQLVNLADSAANKSRNIAFVASLQVHLADLRSLINDYPEIQSALVHLKANPNLPAAQLAVGKFYALRKGQWQIGLPHLALSNDPMLRGLALRDLANPGDGPTQTQVGDAWWDYAQQVSGSSRKIVQNHAREWYRRAEKSLKGITLALIQSRLQDSAATDAGANALPGSPEASSAVDLLALLDLAKDTVEGKWSFIDQTLQCTTPSKHACVVMPYAPADDYDLSVSFSRTEGDGPLTVLLTSRNRAFDFTLDAKGTGRFERVANTIARNNPTAVPVLITNGQRYTLTIQLRADHIAALLNNKPLTQWKTDYKDLSHYAIWKLPNEKSLALAINNSKVTVYSLTLIETGGKGHPTR